MTNALIAIAPLVVLGLTLNGVLPAVVGRVLSVPARLVWAVLRRPRLTATVAGGVLLGWLAWPAASTVTAGGGFGVLIGVCAATGTAAVGFIVRTVAVDRAANRALTPTEPGARPAAVPAGHWSEKYR